MTDPTPPPDATRDAARTTTRPDDDSGATAPRSPSSSKADGDSVPSGPPSGDRVRGELRGARRAGTPDDPGSRNGAPTQQLPQLLRQLLGDLDLAPGGRRTPATTSRRRRSEDQRDLARSPPHHATAPSRARCTSSRSPTSTPSGGGRCATASRSLPAADGTRQRGRFRAVPVLRGQLRRRLPLPTAGRTSSGGLGRAAPVGASRSLEGGRRHLGRSRRQPAGAGVVRAAGALRAAVVSRAPRPRSRATSSCPTASASAPRYRSSPRIADSSALQPRSSGASTTCVPPSAFRSRSAGGRGSMVRECWRCSSRAATANRSAGPPAADPEVAQAAEPAPRPALGRRLRRALLRCRRQGRRTREAVARDTRRRQ
jgi:hypothetical protein